MFTSRTVNPKVMSVRLAVLLAFFHVGASASPGHWVRHTIDNSLAGGDGARLADFNGDGFIDIVVGWEQSGKTRIYFHPGFGGNPREKWHFIELGNTPEVEDAFPVDLDGDGRLDVLTCTDAHQRVIAHFAPRTESEAWETRVFPSSVVPATNWMFATAADVDGDGRPEAIVGGKSTGTVAQIGWLKPPEGDARDLDRWRFHKIGDVGWTMSLIPYDFNADGRPDLLVSDRRPNAGLQGVRWLENPGSPDGVWRNHEIGAMGEEVMFADLGDLTGDGRPEVLVVTRDRRILWFERTDHGAWRENVIHWPGEEVGRFGKAVALGEYSAAGDRSVVLSTVEAGMDRNLLVSTEGAAGRVGIFRLTSGKDVRDPRWSFDPISTAEGEKFDLVVLADLDGDGDLDVLSTEEANNSKNPSDSLGVVWYENPRL
jgi:hypothetical protein